MAGERGSFLALWAVLLKFAEEKLIFSLKHKDYD